MPFMKPVDSLTNNPSRQKKSVTFRPLPKSGIDKMGQWIVTETWKSVFEAESAHEKANVLQQLMMDKLNLYLPQKTAKFTSDDQPWVTPEIKDIDRKKKREYVKHRKSEKWKRLNSEFHTKCKQAKNSYYTNIVEDLKTSNPSQWYSKLKRMTSNEQINCDQMNVEEISNLNNQCQAEAIADSFSSISNEYKPLESRDINIEGSCGTPSPTLEAYQVYEYLKRIKTKVSTVKDDIPATIIKEFAVELSSPLADIINCSIKRGEYANIWKVETVTPVPKVYPPKKVTELRKISSLKIF